MMIAYSITCSFGKATPAIMDTRLTTIKHALQVLFFHAVFASLILIPTDSRCKVHVHLLIQ